MEVVMFQRSTVRLQDHCCLKNRDLSRICASCPPFPLVQAIPVAIHVSPETVVPTDFTPCVHFRGTFTMQRVRGLKSAIRVRDERMEVKMAADNFKHCFTFLLCCWFQPSFRFDSLTL